MADGLEHSRIRATAATLGASAEHASQFLEKRVLLVADEDYLDDPNGRDCFEASVHMLPRVCPSVTIVVRDQPSVDLAIATVSRMCFMRAEIRDVVPDDRSFDAVLHVGSTPPPDDVVTSIRADGWIARVAAGGRALPRQPGPRNPATSLAAASLGVTEVFKRLARVRADRGPAIDRMDWNLYSYRCDDLDVGRALPRMLELDLLLAGGGAIGNGILYALRRLEARGRVLIADPQAFGEENVGTCILIGPDDVGVSKAKFAAEFLRAHYAATPHVGRVATANETFGQAFPKVVLGALDRIDARHEAQDLWPDIVIDGAISPLMCQASVHPVDGDVACARCLFVSPPGETAEVVAARATGLAPTRATEPESLVTLDDIRTAPESRQAWLRERVGKPVCSVVSEAMMSTISESEGGGFAPSAPFVACLSAAMVISELVKVTAGWATPLEPRFQFDVLRGPQMGDFFPQVRRASCACTARAQNIARWRATRGGP